MCGIAGFHVINAVAFMAAELESMARILRHRGPDDEGYLAVDTKSGKIHHLGGPDCQLNLPRARGFRGKADLYLAHRRLSIIDTTPSGHQPMSSHDNRRWIVFNGEIYNFPELRLELEPLGFRFRTGTDTEVVLAAYQAWGLECLRRFNGMWAFALYDSITNRLILCRDRFGVKPLYYVASQKLFAFASEIKALAKVWTLRPDPGQVFDYLMFGWEGEKGKTFFQGVCELEPGTVLEYSLKDGRIDRRCYYHLPVNDECPEYSRKQAEGYCRQTAELFQRSVELRLRSDVPLGSCLSGGLDSSAIVGSIDKLMKGRCLKQVGRWQALFTAGYQDYSRDERGWAKMMAEATSSHWYITYPTAAGLASDIEDLVYTQEVPFISTSVYAQYRVMKLARERGVKVLLDGQGADELFGGYAGFVQALQHELAVGGRWGTLWREWRSNSDGKVDFHQIKDLLRFELRRAMPQSGWSLLYRRLRRESRFIKYDFWLQHRDRTQAMAERRHRCLNHMLRDLMTGKSLKNLLRYEDRNSMRFSIESRTPFADDLPLIEYLFRIPGVYKIHLGWSKHLLRVASEGLVPDKIRWRRDKIGFATPEAAWLREIGPALLEYLDSRVSAVLDVSGLKSQWDTIMSEQSPEGVTTVWRFLNLGIWAKVYSLTL